MKLFFMYCLIALRNVKRNPRRSGLTVVAISFGLFCLIIFQALKLGLHREMVLGTVNLDAGALQIHAADYEANLAALTPIPEVGRVVTALKAAGVRRFALRLKTPALILAGKRSSSVILSGVDPAREAGVTFIADRLQEGAYLPDEKGILIGAELAESLNLKLGDQIKLMAQDAFGKPVAEKFPISGIYRTGLASFNRTHVYLRRSAAQSFLDLDADDVTEIAVKTDPAKAQLLAAELKETLPADAYQVRTWQEIAPDVQQLIELNDATMRLLIFIVFCIVAMGIANTMTTVIYERFRELGILAAIGTAPGGIVSMVVLESFFIGCIGTALGSMIALLACSYLNRYGIDLTHFTSSNQYFAASHVLKTVLTIKDFAGANLITLLTAVIGGIYPAWKAGRLEPVDAILHT